jgi:hypothetical protein
MSGPWKIVGVAAAVAVVGLITAPRLFRQARSITLKGAVIVADSDARKQAPIAGVVVSATVDPSLARGTSDFSGFFSLPLPRTVAPGDIITLAFRHPEYQALDLQVPSGGQLCIAHLSPIHPPPQRPATQPEVMLSDLVVRYSVETRTDTNVGSGVKAFEVINTGNVPCAQHSPCSPDGRWQANVGGASMDAGDENEFRNVRLSCIAGPCPFTRIEADNYSRGGRHIGASIRGWSDTTTFVLEAEVYRAQLANTTQHSHPIILGRGLNFTLPASAVGPSIQAEVNGEEVVFPLGPRALLSWATCEVRTGNDHTKVYRCELKPGYTFKRQEGE